jgi:hypothetical protein
VKSPFSSPDDYVFATRNGTSKSVTNTCRGFRIVFQRAGLYLLGLGVAGLARRRDRL